jgi:hypothetical protein
MTTLIDCRARYGVRHAAAAFFAQIATCLRLRNNIVSGEDEVNARRFRGLDG